MVLVASLPALVVGLSGVASGPALKPYYTEIDGRMPFAHFIRFTKELPSSFLPAAIVGVVLAILVDFLITRGALKILNPARPSGEPFKVRVAILEDGFKYMGAFLRATLLGVVFAAVGAALIRRAFKGLDIMGYHSGWTGLTTALRLPILALCLTIVWIAVAGAWVFWCKLLVVADDRRRIWRTGILVLRVFKRYPFRSLGLFVVLTNITMDVSGAVLFAWRQAEPKTRGGAFGWLLLWLFTLLIQSFVWLWLVRAGRLLYASEGLADLRAKPDAPMGLLKRLFRRRRPAPAPSPSATNTP